MKFIDSTEITVVAGNGGSGLLSFRSAKGRPKAGVDGGDGGFGGNVYVVGSSGLNTLASLYYRREYAARHGGGGGPNNRNGANGEDLVIPVPLGCELWDRATEEKVCEVLEEGKPILIAKGGKRGIGNYRYLSSKHQAPEEHTVGGKGIRLDLKMTLKLMADVGLAGFPNAGKSTLVSRISAARPKIADYPFTTLVPQLGVVSLTELEGPWGGSFVIADIPGLIEGAHLGKGLGLQFLQHLERTRIVVFLVDGFGTEMEPFAAYETLRHELTAYDPKLASKRTLIALSKIDLAADAEAIETQLAVFRNAGLVALPISAHSGKGLLDLKRAIKQILDDEAIQVSEGADVAADAPLKEATWNL